MINIKNYIDEVKDYYYIKENGEVVNTSNNNELKVDKGNRYTLMLESGRKKKFTIKALYRACYNKEFTYNDVPIDEGEEWREVANTNGCYFVSNKGRIFSKNKKYYGEVMIPNETREGYLRLQIVIEGEKKDKLVHDVVAEAFLDVPQPIPLKGYAVHHKDFNKKNCCVDNLQIITHSKHRQLHEDYKKRKEVERV